MAIKDMLSKISQFSLKSKVGLGVMAVLCGVLSWSVASNYFSGDDDGGKRRRAPASKSSPTAKNTKGSNKADNEAAQSGNSDDGDSPVTSMAGSSFADRFNNSGQDGSHDQPPPEGYYGNRELNSSGGDRYSGYDIDNQTTEGSAGTAAPLGAIAGSDTTSGDYRDRYSDYRNGVSGTGQQTDGTGSGNANDSDLNNPDAHDPFASSRAGGFGSTGSAENTAANSSAGSLYPNSSATSNGPDRYNNTTSPGYATTPGSTSGTELPKLDRSTPALDRSAPTTSAATNQLTNSDQAFRSSGDQDWSNSSGSQTSDTAAGTFKGGRPLPPNANPSYPRGTDHQANTVSAGGNRRMESINSTPSAEPATVVADNTTHQATSAGSLDEFNSRRNMQAIEQQPTVIDQTVREFTAGDEDSFWTIAKQAYGEGGYFAALHAFNSTAVPRIEDLRVGDVVRAPSTALLRQQFPSLCPEEKKPAVATPPNGTPANNTSSGRRADVSRDDKVNFAYAADSDKNSQVQQAGGVANRALPAADGRVYVTKDGDDLFAIARDELGSAARWADLYELNKDTLGEKIDELAAGLELKLPR